MSQEQQSIRSENSPQDTHCLIGKTSNNDVKTKIVGGNGANMQKYSVIHCEMGILREVTVKSDEGPRRSLRSRELGNEEQYSCFCPQEKMSDA